MVIVETTNYVRTITLNRPDALNAFNRAMWRALIDAIDQAKDDSSARVVVITGAGRAFSAGAALQEKSGAAAMSGAPGVGVSPLVEGRIEFPKPVIAALNWVGVGLRATPGGWAGRGSGPVLWGGSGCS